MGACAEEAKDSGPPGEESKKSTMFPELKKYLGWSSGCKLLVALVKWFARTRSNSGHSLYASTSCYIILLRFIWNSRIV